MSVWFWIFCGVAFVASLVSIYFTIKCADVTGEPDQIDENRFWANKCHEAFDNAQEAFSKGDEYSFRKFAEQHALYYRRYKMARDGHFERKTE